MLEETARALRAGEREQLLERLCAACVRLLPVAGASISLYAGDGGQVTLCASDEVAARLAEIQYSLGEGPGMRVRTVRAPVFASDLTSGPDAWRWPLFAREATAAGARAVCSFPLGHGGTVLGTLDMYSVNTARPGPGSAPASGPPPDESPLPYGEEPLPYGGAGDGSGARAHGGPRDVGYLRDAGDLGDAGDPGDGGDGGDGGSEVAASDGVFGEREIRVAVRAADAVTLALATMHGRTPCPESGGAAWFARAEAGHEEVYRATGMLMVRLGVDADEALASLRARAFAEDRTVTEVARRIVSRTDTGRPGTAYPGNSPAGQPGSDGPDADGLDADGPASGDRGCEDRGEDRGGEDPEGEGPGSHGPGFRGPGPGGKGPGGHG